MEVDVTRAIVGGHGMIKLRMFHIFEP